MEKVKAKREKGSEPSCRACAPAALHREPECVLTRRLKRLFRAAEEQKRYGCPTAALSRKMRAKWRVLASERIFPELARQIPESWEQAAAMASKLFTKESKRQEQQRQQS